MKTVMSQDAETDALIPAGNGDCSASTSVYFRPANSAKSTAFWWSICGTVLSVVGFVGLALFQQYNSALSELRADLKHFNEVSGELVKKESLRRCIDHLIECKKELQTATASRATLEREFEDCKKDRAEMAREVQHLRERLAALEGSRGASPIIVLQPQQTPSALEPATPVKYVED
jgi:hypothetical protein